MPKYIFAYSNVDRVALVPTQINESSSLIRILFTEGYEWINKKVLRKKYLNDLILLVYNL